MRSYLVLFVLIAGCPSSNGGDTDTDADADADTDADSDADTDADSDADTDADSDADTDADSDADTDADSDADTDADTDTDTDVDSVTLYAEAVDGTSGTLLVSNGVPFPKGALTSTDDLVLTDADGEVSVYVASLATWQDSSIRSVLLQFEMDHADLPAELTLSVGGTRSTSDRAPVAVDWTLPEAVAFPDGDYLAASGAFGPTVPVGAESWMAAYDAAQKAGYDDLKGTGDWGSDCRYDGYYSTTHAWYQLFGRSGDLEVYEWARREAVHYRDDQIVQSGAYAGTMNSRSEPRYLYLKAMEQDYLLNGDPKTLAVSKQMADYLLATWDEDWFFYAKEDESFWTERRSAFALMGLIVYGRFSGDSTYLDATHDRLDALLATQAEWPDGGWLHHLYAHDSEECPDWGAYGGSPFMTGLLYEALIAYYEWFEDERVVDAIVLANDWMWDEGWAGDGFSYLIGCPSDSSWSAPDLNLLVAHGYAFAYHHTGDVRHQDRGMEVFDEGVAGAWLGARKQYNQNHRSGGAFLWYMTR